MYSTKKMILPVAESAYISQSAQFGLVMSWLTVMQKTLLPVQFFDLLFFGNFCGDFFVFFVFFRKKHVEKISVFG